MANFDLEIILPSSGKTIAFNKSPLTLGESMGLNELLLAGTEPAPQKMFLEIIKSRGYLDKQRLSVTKNTLDTIPNADYLFLISNQEFTDLFTYYISEMTGGLSEKKSKSQIED